MLLANGCNITGYHGNQCQWNMSDCWLELNLAWFLFRATGEVCMLGHDWNRLSDYLPSTEKTIGRSLWKPPRMRRGNVILEQFLWLLFRPDYFSEWLVAKKQPDVPLYRWWIEVVKSAVKMGSSQAYAPTRGLQRLVFVVVILLMRFSNFVWFGPGLAVAAELLLAPWHPCPWIRLSRIHIIVLITLLLISILAIR